MCECMENSVTDNVVSKNLYVNITPCKMQQFFCVVMFTAILDTYHGVGNKNQLIKKPLKDLAPT